MSWNPFRRPVWITGGLAVAAGASALLLAGCGDRLPGVPVVVERTGADDALVRFPECRGDRVQLLSIYGHQGTDFTISQMQESTVGMDSIVEFKVGPGDLVDGELISSWTVLEAKVPSGGPLDPLADGRLILRIYDYRTSFDFALMETEIGSVTVLEGSDSRDSNLTVEVVDASEADSILSEWCSSR